VAVTPVTVRPTSAQEVTRTLSAASRSGRTVRIVGGGTHEPVPRRAPEASIRLETIGMARLLDYLPADLTVTVEAGVPASDLARTLAAEGQCWPQADTRPGATVGGILAAAASGRRRLREGPVRDSLLEVVVVTGDGRLVTGGGRTVKNVSGFDIPRLMVGALGTLGVIVQATLKLWPQPPAAGWFHAGGTPAERVALARAVLRAPARPSAVLMSPGALDVELTGTAGDVRAPDGMTARRTPPAAFDVPAHLMVGVPPARLGLLAQALEAEGFGYEAQMGVGGCAVAVADRPAATAVRGLAEDLGGHAVLARDTLGIDIDPWGDPPAGLAQMRRLRAAFDPAGILNPGHFVGDAPVTVEAAR